MNAAAGNTGIPIINGGERWALVSPVGTLIDEASITGARGKSYHRVATASWEERLASEAAPGSSPILSGAGLVVTQWSDADGSGAYVYEFVQISYAP